MNKSIHLTTILILGISMGIIYPSCTKNENKFSPTTQSMIEFPEDLSFEDNDFIPDYLDAEKVLCKGKGLKVGRCINKQLKKGVCLGIIKHEKRIYAIEIPCDDIKEEPSDSTLTQQQG